MAFTPTDDGTYTFVFDVVDDDSGIGTDIFTVTVNNVAPTAALGNAGPVNEGSPVLVSFSGEFDPSAADTAAGFRYSFATSPAELKDTYADAGPSATTHITFADSGTHTVYGRVFDKDGGFTEYTTTVTVNNVAPTVGDITAPRSTPSR